MSFFITKRRIVSLISTSAIIGAMAVAAVPAATMAASACTPTGFVRDGIDLTAARIGGSVTGELDATGCDIAVYNPTKVANADIHGARYYGVVVNGGGTVNTTGSKVHQIGDSPFDGMQRGRAILYINGADGTISGNKVYTFQKNGIEVRGMTADGSAPAGDKSFATISNNVVVGRGHLGDIAQNGIVILGNASATVKGNTVSHLWYTGPADTYATGMLVDAGKVTVSGNTFIDTEVRIDGVVTAPILGHWATTVRPHGVHVDLRTGSKPGAQAVFSAKLDWKIKVDGSVKLHVKQGFGEHAAYDTSFKTGSGRHVVQVYRNDHLVRTVVVRF
jgi:hypothetical protein